MAAPRYVILAALLLAAAGLLSFAALRAGVGEADPASTPTPTPEGATAPAATMTPAPPAGLSEPGALPEPTSEGVVIGPGCALIPLGDGNPIYEHDESGRAIEVRRLESVRNECTGEVLTRDASTGELKPCGLVVTLPAEPTFRINDKGEEVEVGLSAESIIDFCTGEYLLRDTITGEIRKPVQLDDYAPEPPYDLIPTIID